MDIYNTKLFNLSGAYSERKLSLEEAFDLVHSNSVDVILLNVDTPEEIGYWWGDDSSLAMNHHKYYQGIVTSGMTLGKLQRATHDEYPETAEKYFNSAKIVNSALTKTHYYKFFEHGLNARPLETDNGDELLIASQREYPPSNELYFSFPPHADSISYARAGESWPIKEYHKQTAAFITIQNATNSAGFVMWDYVPESRNKLDEFIHLYNENNNEAIDFLNQHEHMEIKPEVGQLCIFNCRKMHAIQTCDSLRKTIGSFFIKKDSWRIFD